MRGGESPLVPLRVVLICHHDAPIHFDGIARWLSSWAQLTGVVVIREPGKVLRRRLRRELHRVGPARLLDVLAFRLFYRFRHAQDDAGWLAAQLDELKAKYPAATAPRIEVASPNSAESREFIAAQAPDVVIALCKNILAERVFSIARHGTVVFHPGICPEYRNAHGCFWALASGDREHVGMTVLKIDKGIDTGPVLGYFPVAVDEVEDTHVRIQHRVLLDNLDGIQALLLRLAQGAAAPIDVTGRPSKEWGQPWLTTWWRWKSEARRRLGANHRA